MSETVPSVIASIDPGLRARIDVVVPNPIDVVVVVAVVVAVAVAVVVVVDDPLLRDPGTIPLVRVRAPQLVQPEVNPGPDLEPEHPDDHREDRERPPGLGAEHASRSGSRHRNVQVILLDKRSMRKDRGGSLQVRGSPTRGSARIRARTLGDPPAPGARSAREAVT